MVGPPTIRNEPATVSNLVGLDKKCPTGKLNGAYEHFDADAEVAGRTHEPRRQGAIAMR